MGTEQQMWAGAAAVQIANGNYATGLQWIDELAASVQPEDLAVVHALRVRTMVLRDQARSILATLELLAGGRDEDPPEPAGHLHLVCADPPAEDDAQLDAILSGEPTGSLHRLGEES
jgi:hypothetical protein